MTWSQLTLKSHIEATRFCMAIRGGSIGRASASRSNGFHDQRFESRPEHKKKLWVFWVKMLWWLVGVSHPVKPLGRTFDRLLFWAQGAILCFLPVLLTHITWILRNWYGQILYIKLKYRERAFQICTHQFVNVKNISTTFIESVPKTWLETNSRWKRQHDAIYWQSTELRLILV